MESIKRVALAEVHRDEARRLIRSGAIVYVFVNPIENHGPHLPLNTDFMISDGLMERIHPVICQAMPEIPQTALIYPPLPLGSSPASGVGTVATSYLVLRKILRATARSLVGLEAKRVVFLTFHGGPLHNLAIESAVKILSANGVRALSPLNLILELMLDYKPGHFREAMLAIPNVADREMIDNSLGSDVHGGFFETSLMLSIKSDSVMQDRRNVPDCPAIKPDPAVMFASKAFHFFGAKRLAKEFAFIADAIGWMRLKPFPGYTGYPRLASREVGDIFVQDIVDRYVAALVTTFKGDREASLQFTRAPFRWLIALSLFGLLDSAEDFRP